MYSLCVRKFVHLRLWTQVYISKACAKRPALPLIVPHTPHHCIGTYIWGHLLCTGIYSLGGSNMIEGSVLQRHSSAASSAFLLSRKTITMTLLSQRIVNDLKI